LLVTANDPSIDLILITASGVFQQVLDVASLSADKWWLLSRSETHINDVHLPNVIYAEYYHEIIWYLKGVLAALFSNSTQFCITLPSTYNAAEYTNDINFYYAGLVKYKPNATLIAIKCAPFDFSCFYNNEVDILFSCKSRYPSVEVLADFSSGLNWPPLMHANNMYEISSNIGVYSPQSDYDVLMYNRSLAITLWNVSPLLESIIIDASNGINLTRRIYVQSEHEGDLLVDIIVNSNITSSEIQKTLRNLRKKYLLKNDNDDPGLFCQDFIANVYKEIYGVVNGCVDAVSYLGGKLLHPSIQVFTAGS